MRKKKNVLCLWSGGLDSTAMIWKLLVEGNNVDAVYSEIMNNEDKTKAEKRARRELKPLLLELAAKNNVSFRELDETVRVKVPGLADNVAMPQAPVWLFSMIMSTSLDKYDHIAVGYVRNDDAISYLDDLRNVFNSYNKIFPPLSKKIPSLIFPLKKYSKMDLLAHVLPDKVAKMTWSCETSYDVPCGTCLPCKRRKELRIDDKHVDEETTKKIAHFDDAKEKKIDVTTKEVPADQPGPYTHEDPAGSKVQEDIGSDPSTIEVETCEDKVGAQDDSSETEKTLLNQER